jgi:hypothetical protein
MSDHATTTRGTSSRLSGRWTVQRTGGFLPPLVGVAKEIDGDHGWTTLAGVRAWPFDVVGLELHYKRPFSGLVDVLEPETETAYAGTATFRGRRFGTFRMSRSD